MSARDVPPTGPDRTGVGPTGDDRIEDLLRGAVPEETENAMHLDGLLGELRAPGTADELRAAEATGAAFVRERRAVLGLDEPAGETATRLPLVVGAALTEKPELEISPLAKEKASVVPLSSRRRRPALVAGVATASVTVAVLFAGTAAAAFTGSLPAPLQRVAHSLVGAPAPDAVDDLAVTTAEATGSPQSARPSTPSSPARSDHGLATGPSAPALAGLCHAFAGRTPSDGVSRSTAYAALRSAAAKAGQSVDDYCSAHHVAPTPRGSGHGLASAPGQRPGHHGNGGQPGQGAGARHGSGPGNGNGNSNVKRGGTGAGLSSTTGSGHGRGPGGQSGPSHVGARGGSGTASSGHASHSAVH